MTVNLVPTLNLRTMKNIAMVIGVVSDIMFNVLLLSVFIIAMVIEIGMWTAIPMSIFTFVYLAWRMYIWEQITLEI